MMDKVQDNAGQDWHFDAQRMAGFLRSAAYMKATVDCSAVTLTRDHWLQRIRAVPATAEVTSNLKSISQLQNTLLNEYHGKITTLKEGGWADLEAFLAIKRAEFEQNKAKSQGMFSDAQAQNDMAIAAAETGIQRATFVRDASITSLGIIATVSTGGMTLVLATGAQATLQGVATYQDKGDIGKAVADAAFVAIPIGVAQKLKQARMAGEVTKGAAAAITLVVEVGTETAKEAYVEDAAIEAAIAKALVKQAGDAALKGLTKELSTQVGKELRDTIRIMNDHSGEGSNRATPLLVEAAKGIGKGLGTAAAQGMHGTTPTPPNPPTPPGVPIMYPNIGMVGRPQCVAPTTSKMWVNANVLRRAG